MSRGVDQETGNLVNNQDRGETRIGVRGLEAKGGERGAS